MTASPAHDLTEAVLRPVRGHHAFEACVEQLATTIRLGVYPLGSTLPSERELAARLKVSRATLREAIAALRQAGLVQTTRGRGRRHRGDPQAAHTLGPRRGADLAGAAAGLAGRARLPPHRRAGRGPPGGTHAPLARPRGPSSRRRTAPVAGARKPAQHRQADSRFHLTVAALTGSARLVEAVTSVQAMMHEMLLAIPVLDANIAHSDRQHAALVRAVLAGDADRARTVMEEHCDDTAALLRGLVG